MSRRVEDKAEQRRADLNGRRLRIRIYLSLSSVHMILHFSRNVAQLLNATFWTTSFSYW
jgi:hypothetical protein